MFQTSYVFRTFHPPFSSLLPHPLGDTPLPPVLIAPLFAIFVLREALSVVTRERKKEKKGRRGKRRKKKNLFTTISSPFILATSLWRALRHRFSDALHLFIGTRAGLLSLSLSLSFSSSFSFIHHAHCASSVAANEPRPLSLAKNAISAMTFHQKMNIVRSTYLFNYWLEYLSFFHVISGNFDEISFQNV